MPELHADYRSDLETCDRDVEVKAKTKAYADKSINARQSDVQVGDQVLVRQEKKDVVVDRATAPSTPARPRCERPQRQRTLPQKYKDFVLIRFKGLLLFVSFKKRRDVMYYM